MLTIAAGFYLASAQAADLAIVIDDVGYSKAKGLRAIDLHGPVTIAFLPFAPRTQELLQYARAAGKPLILHQPMQAASSRKREAATLTSDMTPPELLATLERSIAAVPGILGISNHTGSLLTQDPIAMRTLMRRIAQHDLFFLDSRTTAGTVAETMALMEGVAAMRRDVFLDNDLSTLAIAQAFQRAINVARRQGHAVAIGHPHTVTLDFLNHALTRLPEDVQLVGLDTLVRRRTALVQATHPTAPRISLGQ